MSNNQIIQGTRAGSSSSAIASWGDNFHRDQQVHMSVRPRAATTKNCLENRGALGVIFSHDDLPLERRTPYRFLSLHMVVGGAASFVTARDMFAKVLFREIPMQSQGPGRGKAEKDAWLWCLGETMAFLSEWMEEVRRLK